MPTRPYYVELEKELFARLAVVRERARAHKLTIKTHGKDTQPKRFTFKRRGDPDPIFWASGNSLAEIENYLDQVEAGGPTNRLTLSAGRRGSLR
jgi:hypothetical protein